MLSVRDQFTHVLHVAVAVWRDGFAHDQAIEGARGRESSIEADVSDISHLPIGVRQIIFQRIFW